MSKNRHVLLSAVLLALLPAAGIGSGDRILASPSLDNRCNIDAVPAATLLFPYFTVDLERNSQGELQSFRNVTAFTVTNADSAPHLARVTLWTNWAIPTLSFDVYLAGYDVSTFNVFDMLTGLTFSGELQDPDGPGPLSEDNVVFPGCSSQVVRQGVLLPPRFGRRLQPDAFTPLIEAHKGHPVYNKWYYADRTPLVWASPRVDVAVGYITVDVVNRCSQSFPSDSGYFVRGGQGIAGNENVLLGEYTIYEPAGGRSYGDTAVHIRADANAFAPGDYTFYGRYVRGNAADGRQPLGTAFASRFITDLPFAESANTYILVWRDTKRGPGAPLRAGRKPNWYPLAGEPMLMFDETTDLAVVQLTDETRLATQSVDLDYMGSPFPFGWVMLDLDHRASNLFGGTAQGWVTTLMAAGITSTPPRVHIGVGCRAFRLASPCDVP